MQRAATPVYKLVRVFRLMPGLGLAEVRAELGKTEGKWGLGYKQLIHPGAIRLLSEKSRKVGEKMGRRVNAGSMCQEHGGK